MLAGLEVGQGILYIRLVIRVVVIEVKVQPALQQNLAAVAQFLVVHLGDIVAQFAQLDDLFADLQQLGLGALELRAVQLVVGSIAQRGQHEDLLPLVIQQLLHLGGQLRRGHRVAIGNHALVTRETAPEMRAHVDREQNQDGDQREGKAATQAHVLLSFSIFANRAGKSTGLVA